MNNSGCLPHLSSSNDINANGADVIHLHPHSSSGSIPLRPEVALLGCDLLTMERDPDRPTSFNEVKCQMRRREMRG
jgi:hypothetical protein